MPGTCSCQNAIISGPLQLANHRLRMLPRLPPFVRPEIVPKAGRHQYVAPNDLRLGDSVLQSVLVAGRQLEHRNPDPFGELGVARFDKWERVAGLPQE